MPSGERIGGNNGEDSGNKESRELYQARGEMTVEAELEAREQERLKALERERELAKMYEAIVNEKKTSELIKKAAKAMIEDPEFATALDKAAEESSDKPAEESSDKPEAESGQQTAEGQGETSNEQPTGNTGEASSEGPETPPVVVGAPGEASTDSTPESNDNPERVDGDSVEVLPADPETVNRIAEKSKKNGGFRKFLISATAIGLAAWMAISSGITGRNKKEAPLNNNNPTTEASFEGTDMDPSSQAEMEDLNMLYAGELPNGVGYDYTEYADTENKTSKNAFGYDKSDCYGNREATEDAWMDMARKGPEYLASYAYYIFTDAEKESLGIKGMNSAEIDDYLSNSKNADAGEKQKRILEALNAIARDKENTFYEFYRENDKEKTYYISFVDANGDGIYSPEELKLGYATKKRNGALQVDIIRIIDGKKVKCLDLNMECGLQPNDEEPPEGLPEIEDPEPDSAGKETSGKEDTGKEGTGKEGTGKEGTGKEGTGKENTDPDPTAGAEGTNPTAGAEGTNPTAGAEGTNPTAGAEGTTPPTAGSEGTVPDSAGVEGFVSKDTDNMTRIDNEILDSMATDVGTYEVTVGQTPSDEVENDQPRTDKATGDAYEGTEATIKENNQADSSQKIEDQVNSPDNKTSDNRGGANEGEYNPVKDNNEGQKAADAAATPVAEAPTDSKSVADTMANLSRPAPAAEKPAESAPAPAPAAEKPAEPAPAPAPAPAAEKPAEPAPAPAPAPAAEKPAEPVAEKAEEKPAESAPAPAPAEEQQA